MAEQQKEDTSLDRKDKKSLLEEDISKEFLTSWKSMSVAGDDPMDFSFDTVGKSQKAFNFDKLDMDFSLDSADFDVSPSFNVDLPELDFSSLSKKCHQDKEKTEEGSLNNRGVKKDRFSFSFHYNELDAFDFGASMKKREGMVHKGRDNQVASPLTVESQCFKSKSTKAPISIGMDGNSNKLSTSKNLTAEMNTTMSLRVPNSSRTANPIPTSSTSSSPILEKEVGTSTERVAVFNAKEHEKSRFLEKSVSEATFFLPSTEDNANLSDCEEVISSDASGAPVSGPEKNENVRDTSFPKDTKDGTDNGKAEVHIQDTTPDGLSNVQHHSTDRGPEVEKVVPVSKYNDSRDVSLKFYKKPGPTVPQSHMDSLLGEKHGDIISKGLSIGSIKLAEETRSGRNDVILQSGRKLVSSLGLPSKELTKSHNEVLAIQEFCEKSKKVGMTSSTVMASMLSPTSQDHPDIIWSPIDMPSKSSPTTCLLPNMTRNVGSTLTSRFDKVDGDKAGSIKSSKNNHGLSSLRNLRTLRTKEDLLSSTTFKENLPIVNSEQKTDQNNSELEVAKGANTQKTPLVTLSLKRKNLEVANDDIPSFLPLKRLSESPKENRSFKVPSERVLMKEVNDTEIHNTYASSRNETIQVTDSYKENQQKVLLTDNAAGAEFFLTCETDSNVSKAEAYAKELQDICDLLRKKQEEAKELLVRALVNNNNLLLLNRPIYDEKIRAVQNVAAQLLSKQQVANGTW